MYFSINLCGVEDSVENYQTYLIYLILQLWCSSPMESYFFVTHISTSLMIFMLNYTFTHILFSLRILLLAVEMSDRQAFRSQASQIAARDRIKDPCYCTCYFKGTRKRCRE